MSLLSYLFIYLLLLYLRPGSPRLNVRCMMFNCDFYPLLCARSLGPKFGSSSCVTEGCHVTLSRPRSLRGGGGQ